MRLVLIGLSESFSEFWSELATDLEVDVSQLGAREACTTAADTAAIVLAAGGVERGAVQWLNTRRPEGKVPIFAVGADPGRRTSTLLLQNGATDYFALPEDLEIMRNALGEAVDRCRQNVRRVADEAASANPFSEIVGESRAIRTALERASRALPYASSALIVGETGTGKELLARALHQGGPRRGAPFVAVNSSALPAHLAESELFGHERGAFTDAHAAKPGLFEIADHGTLFLDEIDTLSMELQAKLLRALDDGEVRRVGGTRSRKVNVRIIAATNGDLEQGIERGTFRSDLFYRMNVLRLELPPLRERGDDAVIIARTLLGRLAHQHGVAEPRIGPDAARALLSYHWPGNVRELRNAVERALLLSPPGEFRIQDALPAATAKRRAGGTLPFPAELRTITVAAVHATLESCGGNRAEAARRLGISRQRLRRLLKPDREGSQPRGDV